MRLHNSYKMLNVMVLRCYLLMLIKVIMIVHWNFLKLNHVKILSCAWGYE